VTPSVLQSARAVSNTESGKPKRSNLTVRLLTAAVTVPIILWMLLIGPHWVWATYVLVPAMAVSAHELFAMTLPGHRVLQGYGIASTMVLGAGIYLGLDDPNIARVFPAFVVVHVLASQLASLAAPLPSEVAGARMAWLAGGPFYIGGTLALLAALHRLPSGGSWVVLAMMLAWFADTAGYFAGRFLGGKLFSGRMAPKISPNKTWEGAFGAVGGGLIGALLAHFWYLPQLPLGHAVALACIATPLGVCGDLVESLIKRSTGTKDSGWIVPGHGGLIDRIDALMFTSTTTFIYAAYLLP
jgi:phosphatidate cytidylyltransferase